MKNIFGEGLADRILRINVHDGDMLDRLIWGMSHCSKIQAKELYKLYKITLKR